MAFIKTNHSTKNGILENGDAMTKKEKKIDIEHKILWSGTKNEQMEHKTNGTKNEWNKEQIEKEQVEQRTSRTKNKWNEEQMKQRMSETKN